MAPAHGSPGAPGLVLASLGGEKRRLMHRVIETCLVFLGMSAAIAEGACGLAPPASGPLCLHPDNPHYFYFRGLPTVLITSGEHYGAVLNLDFVRMAPDDGAVVGLTPAADGAKGSSNKPPRPTTARALVEKGRQYAVFIRGAAPAAVVLAMPAGAYDADWVNIWTDAVEKSETFDHTGGPKEFPVPPYKEGIALRVLWSCTK